MNKHLYIITIVLIVFISSCKEQDEVTGLTNIEGMFLVDSISTAVSVKNDTITGSQKTYLEYSLVYHFEIYPGSLDKISLVMENSFGVSTFLTYAGPSRTNDFNRYKRTYNFPDSLVNQDSIRIFRELAGAFWTKSTDNTANFLGNYSWKDSIYVAIQR